MAAHSSSTRLRAPHHPADMPAVDRRLRDDRWIDNIRADTTSHRKRLAQPKASRFGRLYAGATISLAILAFYFLGLAAINAVALARGY